MAHRRSLLALSTVLAVVTGTVAVQLLPGGSPVARAEGLVPYAGCDALLAHYRAELRATATPWGLGQGFGFGRGGGIAELASAGGDTAARTSGAGAAAPMAAAADQGAVGAGATGTNLQEQGVDEPDRVKLRDGRLVVLAHGRVQVVSAEAEPRVLGSLRVGEEDESWGSELLLVGDRALVVAPGWRQDPQPEPPATATARTAIFRPGTPTTRLVLVDLTGDQPRLLEEATYDAQYVSARLTGGTVRLVTTTRPQPQQVQPRQPGAAAEAEALAANQRTADALTLEQLLPQVVRTDADGTVLQLGDAVDCARTTHAEEPRGASTLLVSTLQPGRGLAASDSTAVTTDGDLVYASADRLYVATGRWGTTGPVRPVDDTAKATGPAPTDEVTTELHAFDTSSATRTRYVGTGSVPGFVMGRWALSEHEGTLRVATTRQPPWDSERRGDSHSMIVKLEERDGGLVETGRVDGLGKTEQIKAVRYFGDLAAVVTFRQTDPLYLVDLAGAPTVLGELEVPGFSTYLHPLGGGKLLGLGQEADASGRVTGVQASVYDIADPSAPTQVSRVQLGEGWSPALDDSRAFTYDPAQAARGLRLLDVRADRRRDQRARAVGRRGREGDRGRPAAGAPDDAARAGARGRRPPLRGQRQRGGHRRPGDDAAYGGDGLRRLNRSTVPGAACAAAVRSVTTATTG